MGPLYRLVFSLCVCLLDDSPTQRSFCSRCGNKRCSRIDESNAASLLFPPFPAQLWFSGLKGSDRLKESHSSFGASVVAQAVRNPRTVQETWFRSLGGGGSPGKGMAPPPNRILVWEIPRTEEPGGLSTRGREESDTTQATEHTRTCPHVTDEKEEKQGV